MRLVERAEAGALNQRGVWGGDWVKGERGSVGDDVNSAGLGVGGSGASTRPASTWEVVVTGIE